MSSKPVKDAFKAACGGGLPGYCSDTKLPIADCVCVSCIDLDGRMAGLPQSIWSAASGTVLGDGYRCCRTTRRRVDQCDCKACRDFVVDCMPYNLCPISLKRRPVCVCLACRPPEVKPVGWVESKVAESIEWKPGPMPPLGVVPKRIHDERRALELTKAIGRYGDAGKLPDREWVRELAALLDAKLIREQS